MRITCPGPWSAHTDYAQIIAATMEKEEGEEVKWNEEFQEYCKIEE